MKRGKFEYRGGEPENQELNQNTKKRGSLAESVILYLHDMTHLLAVIILALILVFRVVVVSGSSMKNTLIDGDYVILVSNTFYRNPQQGHIIVASKDDFRNGEPIIKRVIAVEGQEVDIDFVSGTVYVDGVALKETYLGSPTHTEEGMDFPLVVEEGCIFVLGDNRMVSQDSRSTEIGLIDRRQVLGRAIFLFLPGTDDGDVPRDFSRIGGLG